MIARICTRYSVQCGQPARCASNRRRRASLEPVDAAQHAQPRVLNHLLGDGHVRDVPRRQAQHRGVVAPDQDDEGLLVARAQADEQFRIRVLLHRRQLRASFPMSAQTMRSG